MFNGITPYKGINTRIRVFQSVGDIMVGILSTHKAYAIDYDKIAPRFDKGTDMQVLRNLYNFLLENTHYKIEPNEKQTLRSPAAIMALGADSRHGLDCKSYSLFIGGVLDALNRRGRKFNWCYRFASYRLYDKIPHHVFVVVNPGTNNEIFVDPVIKPFNTHKPYFYKIDKFPPKMALYSVSGVGRQSRKEKKQAAKQNIVSKLNKTGKVVVKFSPPTVAARNAVLLLVKLNAFRLAENLAKAEAMRPGELKRFWEKLGGNWASLKKQINIGGKKHGAQIGLDPVVTPTVVATSLPILVKLHEFLKKLGLSEADIKKLGKLSQDAIKKAIDKKAETIADTTENNISVEPSETISEANTMPETSPAVDSDYDASGEQDGLGGIVDNIKANPLPWLAGGAVAYYLFSKKRRK